MIDVCEGVHASIEIIVDTNPTDHPCWRSIRFGLSLAARAQITLNVQAEALEESSTLLWDQVVHMEQEASLKQTDVLGGAGVTRHMIVYDVCGSRARIEYELQGAWHGNARADVSATCMHESSATVSRLRMRPIVGGSARVLARTQSIIHPLACDSASQQDIDVLRVGEMAEVHAIPMLDVHTDRATCQHACRVHPFDPHAMWYVMMRGLPLDAARQCLMQGHLRSATHTAPNGSQDMSDGTMHARMVQRL